MRSIIWNKPWFWAHQGNISCLTGTPIKSLTYDWGTTRHPCTQRPELLEPTWFCREAQCTRRFLPQDCSDWSGDSLLAGPPSSRKVSRPRVMLSTHMWVCFWSTSILSTPNVHTQNFWFRVPDFREGLLSGTLNETFWAPWWWSKDFFLEGWGREGCEMDAQLEYGPLFFVLRRG